MLHLCSKLAKVPGVHTNVLRMNHCIQRLSACRMRACGTVWGQPDPTDHSKPQVIAGTLLWSGKNLELTGSEAIGLCCICLFELHNLMLFDVIVNQMQQTSVRTWKIGTLKCCVTEVPGCVSAQQHIPFLCTAKKAFLNELKEVKFSIFYPNSGHSVKNLPVECNYFSLFYVK